MKTIKPKTVNIVIEPKVKVGDEVNVPATVVEVDDKDLTVEALMDSIIQEKEKEKEKEQNPNEVKVEFTLTKRQFSIWEKKGGVKWLKKKLV